MAENTKIEWAHDSWSPWLGCAKVSDACTFCYAETWAKRFGSPELWNGSRRRTSAAYWRKPLKWNEEAQKSGQPRRVFPSLCDPFDNQVPDEWRIEFWSLIARTPSLTWLLLTKRPQNISKMLPRGWCNPSIRRSAFTNVWLGATVENQEEADRRIPHLLKVQARVLFLSCEPLLGPIDLNRAGAIEMDCVAKTEINVGSFSRGLVDWVICGGESGSHARPMREAWALSVCDQCVAAGVPFFFKQWGGRTPKSGGRLLDGREWNEVPNG